MDKTIGNNLINELINNSQDFSEKGKSYDLLQEYFEGYPTDSLKKLLKSKSNIIKQEAIWIVSELSESVCSEFLPEILPLVKQNDDLGIKYTAMECLLLGTLKSNTSDFIYLVKELESDFEVIRIEAMLLISNAEKVQIESCIKKEELLSLNHLIGLKSLLDKEFKRESDIVKMLNSPIPLDRRYGVILIKMLYEKYPALLQFALNSEDPDVKKVAEFVQG